MQLHYFTEKGFRKIRPYSIWSNMMSRCYNSNSINYKYYGGKGIKVCDEWKDKHFFIEWALNNGYADNLTLERIDNSQNYEPSNCKWITWQDQFLNRTGRVGISKISGVSYHKPSNSWRARITIHCKTISLGYFKTQEEATQARLQAEKTYLG